MRFQISLMTILLVSLLGNTGATPVSGQTTVERVVTRKAPAPVVSANFVVTADDPILARKVSVEAERYRKELAYQWLGHELQPWSQKCPILVKVGMHAGGETSFAFVSDGTGRGKPIEWQMKIYGPPNRLLDAVLPHEVTHTIFATHFGCPLPRWADEGACTTVEHISERKKNHKMLLEFLTSQPSRGIPFNRMFALRNYPDDILPLYAQGYSLAKFLIAKKGQRHFLKFVGKGLQNEGRLPILKAWDQATNEFYSFQDLSDLQMAWLSWVRQGSPENSTENLASNEIRNNQPTQLAQSNQSTQTATTATQTFTSDSGGSWYAREMSRGQRVATNREELEAKKTPANIQPHERKPAGFDSRLPNGIPSGSSTIWR